jgi:hypothetical protein
MDYISVTQEQHKNLCEIFELDYQPIEFELIEVKSKSISAFKGLNHTEESKKILSEKNMGEKNPMFGITGEKHHLFGLRGEKTNMFGKKGKNHPMHGYKMSDEMKENLRDCNLGEKNPMFGKKHAIISCPHCKKTGAANGMKRWHFDKCRLNILT